MRTIGSIIKKTQVLKGTGLGMSIVESEEIEKLSKDALVKQLSESIRKSDMGATKPARTVSQDMRDKYAV